MINFIKQAVESVEGIKSFLFNTDYRNNFDLQNVEYPCCVLTPIMRTNYDLNNIIHESAELQLSVVETAPYDYTGDDLYAINKRCSELALQVIANLQVKSKLDKELTFEFILPSGDEFISGVMCNLTATMKQGSCIGKPSYVEIVVQPIKRESITSNGKHIISADSGYNAMCEVEIDVQVVEKADPKLQSKEITISTNNSTTDIVADEGFDGLEKVNVNVDVKPNLQDKSITISENGKQTISADSEFEGLSSVEVTTDINTLQGFDFSEIYDAEQANEINLDYNRWIDYAKTIKSRWHENQTSFNCALYLGLPTYKQIMYFPLLDWSNVKTARFDNCYSLKRVYFKNLKPTHANYLFHRCMSLEHFSGIDFSECESMKYSFSGCGYFNYIILNTTSKLTNIDSLLIDSNAVRGIKLNTDGVVTMARAFTNTSSLEKIELTSIKNVDSSLQGAFVSTWALREVYLSEWRSYNITVTNNNLIPKSIHYIIQNAMNVADGATARILTITATAKTNWQNSEYYEQDLAVLEQKGITIA